MSTTRFRVARYALSAAAMLALCSTAPTAIEAQAPRVYFACYVPLTGTVYRIKEGNLKTACTTGHVEFSWTDGANAVRTTDALGGDLSGVFSNANVVRLLGRALSITPPQPGQVLTWNGTAWVATTPSQGSTGGVSGRQVVHEHRTYADNGWFTVQVSCPQGKVAVSGGYKLDQDAASIPFYYTRLRGAILASMPSATDARMWEFEVQKSTEVIGEFQTTPLDFDFYVVCVIGS